MHRRLKRLTILAAGVTAALTLIAVPGALADGAYSDPAGDSGVAPDISAVAVTHDDAT